MGSKITADGDCSHEIKRHLILGREVQTNLDSILKIREVPFHASQNGCDPKVYKQLMLERVWRKGNPLTCWWECKLIQPLWRTVWKFLKKLEIELPYYPAIPLLGIHTKETRIERDTCSF